MLPETVFKLHESQHRMTVMMTITDCVHVHVAVKFL